MSRFPVTEQPEPTLGEKLAMALDLAEAGVDLMRENLRRRHPQATESELDAMIVAWLRERPGAEQGDGVGRSSPGRFTNP